MFSPQQIDAKKAYLTMLLTLDDISASADTMKSVTNDSDTLLNYFRSFRFLVITLTNLSDNLNSIERALKNLNFQSTKISDLRKSLDFVKHMRNKGVGHLDGQLLEKSIQWQPFMFSLEMKGNIIPSSIFANIAILELAINSYVKDTGEHKALSSVIDFVDPADFSQISDYMLNVSQECIDYMAPRLGFLEEQIKYYEKSETLYVNSVAGSTDFNLKVPVGYSYDKSASLKKINDTFNGCLELIGCDEEKAKMKAFFETSLAEMHSK
jgi:hypothetical protein